MAYIPPRPPVPGETREEALKRDIEYYQRHINTYVKMRKVLFWVLVVLLFTVIFTRCSTVKTGCKAEKAHKSIKFKGFL